jgi:chromatin assembly factor 1 subunit A
MTNSRPRAAGSPSPLAVAVLNGTAPPRAKKPRISLAEREAKRVQKEIKDREKAEEKARKERERNAQAEDRARRDAEKEAERKKKEGEREQKRIAQEAEKATKEEKKRQKEEAKQRAEEEKRKTERAQKRMDSFFTVPAPTTARGSHASDRRSESPAPSTKSLLPAAASPARTSSRPEKTTYEKIFLDFYVRPEVTMAPINRFARDEEASESLSLTIDSYLLGNRSPDRRREFNAQNLFHLSSHKNIQRGKFCMPVREIIAEMSEKYVQRIDLTTDSQNTRIKRTNELLRKIPLKFLKFQEDVRPPYRGTYTSRPVHGVKKLARNPLRRDLPDTNYDYDSEAEWVEDEDAEDLNSEGDEEEDLGEDGEDMEGFLDDENDETMNSKRLVLQGDLEPISTGLCWEDQRKRNTNVKMMPYRMEFILGRCRSFPQFVLGPRRCVLMNTDHNMKTIDPFSTKYWDATPATTAMDPPRLPLNALKSNASIVNGTLSTKPVTSFFKSGSDVLKINPTLPPQPPSSAAPVRISQSTALLSSSHSNPKAPATSTKPKKLMPLEDMNDFKREVEGSNLSKVGLIEVLKKRFPGRSAAAIKSTLEMVAKRVGNKEADKRWALVGDGRAA